MARKRKYGTSFSWKRASGLSAAKGKLSRKIGVPLTKSGRQRKMGKAMGCCVPMFVMIVTGSAVIYGAGRGISMLLA